MKGYHVYSKIQQFRSAGFSQRQVARRLGINRKTVKRYWEMPVDEYEEMSSTVCRMQYLDKYQARILGWLREFPDLTAAQVCDWLREHYREEVSERTVSRYVKQLREEYGLKKSVVPREYEAVPELPMGQQMQVDFGQKMMPNADGGQTRVYVAAFVLSRSRYKYAQEQSRPFTSVDLVRICHDCFQYMDGMPEELVFDQDSIVCVSENAGDIIYTYEFEKFRQECGLSIRMCRGADPESKGKIENVVKYIKGNFLSHRLYVDDGILNGSCLEWLERTANAKVHGTTKLVPAEVFQEEREYLRPLPACDQVKRPVICRTVRKDNTIIYDSNRYSVPLGTYTTQPEVRIETLDGTLYIQTLFGEPICEHRISSGRGLLIQSQSHRRDRTSKLDQLLEELDAELDGKATEFLTAIRVDKSRYARDQFRLIHSLLDQYGREAALQAIGFCRRSRLYSANIMRDCLEHQAVLSSEMRPAPPIPAIPVDLFYETSRYDIKGRQHLKTLGKYYMVDTGLRNLLLAGGSADLGHLIENIVFLELLRRRYKVSIGKLVEKEVAFVAVDSDGVTYYQIAASVLDEATLKRELDPLRKINDNHPKILLTLDEIGTGANYDGIRQYNLIDWLLDEQTAS